jgi:hypothetical protein
MFLPERSGGVKIEVSPGELADRLTILEIKLERIVEPDKRRNVECEYHMLLPHRAELCGPEIDGLMAELKEVNAALWRIEGALRECERQDDFGPRFVELARSVYLTNDRRSAIKRRINEQLGSAIMEEKSYPAYEARALGQDPERG